MSITFDSSRRGAPQQTARSRDQVFDTVVIGAGQAGLATAYHLLQRGLACVVLDARHRIGDQWRHQYDSLRLFTTNRVNRLPGMPMLDTGSAFASKDEFAGYLESYAARFDLPVRLDTEVLGVASREDGFRVSTTRGPLEARTVVIATGPFGEVPAIPAFARDLDPDILQLHSSQYRRPGQLREGRVLVVGGGHSACDIALEVAATHPTVLAGRDPGEVPVSWDGRLIHAVVPIVMFSHTHVHTRRTARGRREREEVLHHASPRLRVKRRHLLAAGVELQSQRVTGTSDGQPVLADGSAVSATNVVWATGFRHDYEWLNLPVLDETGWPREYRGVADDVDGVFFCGLAYQYSAASMNMAGVGRDAAYVAGQIDRRLATRGHPGGSHRRERSASRVPA